MAEICSQRKEPYPGSRILQDTSDKPCSACVLCQVARGKPHNVEFHQKVRDINLHEGTLGCHRRPSTVTR